MRAICILSCETKEKNVYEQTQCMQNVFICIVRFNIAAYIASAFWNSIRNSQIRDDGTTQNYSTKMEWILNHVSSEVSLSVYYLEETAKSIVLFCIFDMVKGMRTFHNMKYFGALYVGDMFKMYLWWENRSDRAAEQMLEWLNLFISATNSLVCFTGKQSKLHKNGSIWSRI